MKNGGLIPWNATAICEISKTSSQMGQHLMKDDLENHSKGQQYLLEHRLNIIRFHRQIKQKIINFGKKVLPGTILGYEPIAERIWKGDIMIAHLEDLEKLDASEI